MRRVIQINDVPEDLQARLEAQAARTGMPLSAYLLAELQKLADRPAQATGPATKISIAVLPFSNPTGGAEDEYFGDGIAEGIRARLSRIRDLRVIASSSMLRYKGRTAPLSELRKALGATHVLSGVVQRRDGRVRIVAQLLDAETEQIDWSETFDRELTDIFAIQADVTSCIAEALQKKLGKFAVPPTAPPGTNDFEAHDLYLRARGQWNERTERATEQSITLFEQALRLDPKYVAAWCGLADSYVTLGLSSAREPATVLEKGRMAAQQALRIDPDSGEALAVLACVTAVYDWRWAAAEELFQRAITHHRTDPITYQWYALNLLVPMGQFTEAREALTYAWGVDPLSPLVNLGTGILSYYMRDYEAARDLCWEIVEEEPSFAFAHYFLGLALEQLGDGPAAIESLQTAVTLTRRGVEATAALAHAYGVFGRREEADTLASELYERASTQYVSPVQLAAVELGRGRTNEAILQLDAALAIRATELIWLQRRPVFDVLHGHPAFDAVVEKLGLPAPLTFQ